MAVLKERRLLKSITVDHEDSTITVVHYDQITKDDEVAASAPMREVFREEDFDRMRQLYPDLAGKYGHGVLGWKPAAAKKAAKKAVRK